MKAYRKNITRTISKSLGRYLAIMAIIALGVGFFSGLKVTKPGMIKTGDVYMRNQNMYDFRVLSNIGFDDDSVQIFEESSDVISCEGSFYQDFVTYDKEEDKEFVCRGYIIPKKVNNIELTAGRMPEQPNECLLDAYSYGKDMIGKEIVLSDTNNEATLAVMKFKRYTVVGLANSPLYINNERGTTSIGNGRIDDLVFFHEDGLSYTSYNELYVKCQDSYEIYTDSYKEFIEDKTVIINELLDIATKARYEKLMTLTGGAMSQSPVARVLDRTSNTGYVCFDNDTNVVSGVAKVFPIFFFLIAALVCSTTMTRMVDDERGQIGTFRALGYTNTAIIGKYMIYSGSSALIGCIAGFFGGSYLFPVVIWKAYNMLYRFGDGIKFYFSPSLLLVCIAVSLICSVGTTYLAVINELRCMPAELIRPKAPSAGKRILLERIGFLWKPMKFLHKVTARNVFRFKKRMLMMIIGLAGCTALVLTGLGVKDSVSNLAAFQYDEIEIHDLEVTFAGEITSEMLAQLESSTGDLVKSYTTLYRSSVEYKDEETVKTVQLMAVDEKDIDDYMNFKIAKGDVSYPGYGEVMLTNKIADIAGVKPGDEITFSYGNDNSVTLKVACIYDNYVWHKAYITPETYEDFFGEKWVPNTIYANTETEDDAYEAGAKLSKIDGVMNVMIVPELKDRVSNMMKMLNAVVWLVIGSAAALAFIVLFNLSNINITERVREIATIKVLGFYAKETGAYVFRENLVLTIMGIIFGIPLGIVLHEFVMNQIQVDMVAFKAEIFPFSYVLCVILVLVFLKTVDLIMRRKLDAIDMAESLKSVE